MEKCIIIQYLELRVSDTKSGGHIHTTPSINSRIWGMIWVEEKPFQHGRCGHLAPGDPQPACLPWPHLAAQCHHPCLTQVALVVFAVHTLVAEENAMDAEKAFVTLTVLNILNKAQAFLPFSIHSVVQVRPRGAEAVREEPCRLG